VHSSSTCTCSDDEVVSPLREKSPKPTTHAEYDPYALEPPRLEVPAPAARTPTAPPEEGRQGGWRGLGKRVMGRRGASKEEASKGGKQSGARKRLRAKQDAEVGDGAADKVGETFGRA
jgi:hypothetical protein